MKTLKTSPNKSGLMFGLVVLDNGGHLVYVKKTNYSQGKNIVRWMCCTLPKQNGTEFQKMAREGLSLDDAEALFKRKINGKAKN